jgi:hypothetical protein
MLFVVDRIHFLSLRPIDQSALRATSNRPPARSPLAFLLPQPPHSLSPSPPPLPPPLPFVKGRKEGILFSQLVEFGKAAANAFGLWNSLI